MMVGVDTGFFFLLESQHKTAVKIWDNESLVTSAIVFYELQKQLLRGHLKSWPKLLKDIERCVSAVPLTTNIALKAGYIAHGTGMPGLDALILASLLEAGCKEIYTTDHHLELYKKKGIKVINLKNGER